MAISRDQIGAHRPVWQTSLVNPDFTEYARLCGGEGFRADSGDELEGASEAAIAVKGRPSLVEVLVSARDV